MGQVILFVLAVLLANVGGWGACYRQTVGYNCGGGSGSCSTCPSNCGGTGRPCDFNIRESVSGQGWQCGSEIGTITVSCTGSNGTFKLDSAKYQRSCSGTNYSASAVFYGWVCSTQCEADSLKGCDNDHIWNADSCKCVPKPPTESDSTFTICTEEYYNGSPQASIYGVTCHYENGIAVRCCGVSPSQITGTGYQTNCPLLRRVSGTCTDNGVPNGPSDPQGAPNENQVPFLPTSRCYATLGSTCYMSDYKSGNTFSCECDGSCQHALDLQVHGQGCRNPYPQTDPSPGSSDSGGDSPSSSDSGNSSGSGGGSDKDYTDQLNQIIANTQGIMNNTGDISLWTQTTMDNTTELKNELSNVAIDVSHINTNTANTANNTSTTAENTGAINNKLSTANQLLEDIKNKNWQPNINVAGDTNIVNVTVGGDTIIVNVGGDSLNINVDTAKAPAEILGFLKGVFGDTTNNYNASDTVGTGTREGDLIAHLDSQVNGGVPDMRDSIPHAVTGVKGALTGLKDSINNGPYGDSLVVWQNQLLNNGVITGSGSNDCPAPLRRSFSWNFGPKIGTVQLGSLRFICEDALGLGFSLWTLARTLLRAMVAICCMLWIYREVTGSGGGSNDED